MKRSGLRGLTDWPAFWQAVLVLADHRKSPVEKKKIMCPTGFSMAPLLTPLFERDRGASCTSAFVSLYIVVMLVARAVFLDAGGQGTKRVKQVLLRWGYMWLKKGLTMRIRQIRNATLVVDYAGVRFLIDPWFEARGTGMLAPSPWPERNVRSPLVDLPCSVEEVLADVNAVVVTHVHPDHFEQYSASLIDHGLPIYVQSVPDSKTVESWGFTDVRVMSLDGSSFGGVTLTRVAARHGLTPLTDCGPASGVVLQASDEPTLYLAGDTVWYEGVADNLRRFKPAVTVLNCCGATLASRGRIIMDEEDVLAVCHAAPWMQVVASHMETVNHGNVSREYLRAFTNRLGVGEHVLIPADGEVLEFL